MNGKKQQKKNPPWALVVFLAIILIQAVSGGSDEAAAILFGIIVVCAVIYVITQAAKTAGAKKETGTAAAPVRRSPDVELHRPAPSMQRREPSAVRRDYTAPEAHCVVCDNTGEDHFARDRAQRIAQLDEWLKNGIIDRDEYRVLKDRYQRDA